ncbi:hypothetical protein [Hymenobacter chitinivorans]|uniref:Uncharacterized protein n=1 Tax=Hymenobacter chitinivorans DSM 11115 TaxID=1121954 RepID=A0A2M9B4Q8_9BACT|nr:hypothetical protein [Hymenobacter chitinivorans]PJJ52906.1 hypothetical protein CLV45_3563 [Hymenobacter chitinivorans DSM 11115]
MSSKATESAAAPTEPTKSVNRASQLPTSAIALAEVATNAAKAWQASELPVLLWLSKTDFAAQAAAFAESRDEADAAGDARTPQSRRLQTLDTLLNQSLRYVKGYLAEANDDKKAYYGEFGIEKVNKSYQLPRHRTERVKSLDKLLKALKAHKFDKNKYGTAHWEPLITEYKALVKDSSDTSGERSGKVSSKDQGEEQVRKALRALIHHIKAQFPDTFEAKLREFGFQKESY